MTVSVRRSPVADGCVMESLFSWIGLSTDTFT